MVGLVYKIADYLIKKLPETLVWLHTFMNTKVIEDSENYFFN